LICRTNNKIKRVKLENERRAQMGKRGEPVKIVKLRKIEMIIKV